MALGEEAEDGARVPGCLLLRDGGVSDPRDHRAPRAELHDEVHVLAVLKDVLEVDSVEAGALLHHRLHLGLDPDEELWGAGLPVARLLGDALHRKDLVREAVGRQRHGPEAPGPEGLADVKAAWGKQQADVRQMPMAAWTVELWESP